MKGVKANRKKVNGKETKPFFPIEATSLKMTDPRLPTDTKSSLEIGIVMTWA